MPPDYSESVVNYLQADLYECLRSVQPRLTDFKVSSFILNLSPIDSSDSREILDTPKSKQKSQNYSNPTIKVKAIPLGTLKKLNFIDETIAKHKSLNIKNIIAINSASHEKRVARIQP